MKSRLLFTLLSTSCLVSYLFFWDNYGIYNGIFQNYLITDVIGAICVVIVFIIVIASLVLSFVNRLWLFNLIPVILFSIYFSRIAHGVSYVQFGGCDMSVCNNLKLYEDGSFFLSSASYLETISKSGTYVFKDNKAILTPSFWKMNFSKVKGFGYFSKLDCIQLELIDFKLPYTQSSICKNKM